MASIAICGEKTMLVDATPDFTKQLQLLQPPTLTAIDAIIISHLHIGHYLGLLQLGKEVSNTTRFPVYLTAENYQFLRNNKPFSYLITRKQIEPHIIEIDQEFNISSDYTIIPISVPHRNEDGNTIAVMVKTPTKSLLYLPDIDYIDDTTRDILDSVDIVIFDGTFYTKNELQRQSNIPHPPMIEIMEVFLNPVSWYFTHFNHSNPVLYDINLQEKVKEMGFKLASDNDIIDL